MNITTSFVIPEEIKAKLVKLAKEAGMSQSRLATAIFTEYLDKQKSKEKAWKS